jgi:hypothetical protein
MHALRAVFKSSVLVALTILLSLGLSACGGGGGGGSSSSSGGSSSGSNSYALPNSVSTTGQ